MTGPPGPETVIDGRTVLYFAGTGYLGLHGHPEVVRAGAEAFAQGTHPATVRTGFGNSASVLDLERRIADFFGTEDAVLYPSGYMSGLFLTRAAEESWDAAFIDENAHPSLREGAAASGRPVAAYRHRDIGDLTAKLAGLGAGTRPLVLTDGVFPSFGEIAPLAAIRRALEPSDGILAVDDAHGVGVLGRRGRGALESCGLESGARIVLAGTLSKAFGGYGGFIPCSAARAAHIRSAVHAYGGSTPLPTPLAAASAKGLELAASHPEWRDALRANALRLKSGLRSLGIAVADTPFPVAAWTLSGEGALRRVQADLLRRGVALARLTYAGTPDGGVLRATVFAGHTLAQIDRLLDELKRAL